VVHCLVKDQGYGSGEVLFLAAFGNTANYLRGLWWKRSAGGQGFRKAAGPHGGKHDHKTGYSYDPRQTPVVHLNTSR
jgi:hypothetical protein